MLVYVLEDGGSVTLKMIFLYMLPFKSLRGGMIFLNIFFFKVNYHQGWVYLIRNAIKRVVQLTFSYN